MRLIGLLAFLVGCPEVKTKDSEKPADDSVDISLFDVDGDGFTPEDGDCDDGSTAVNPEATETCDGVDNNCDERTDEGLKLDWYPDTDGDGYGDGGAPVESACERPEGYAAEGTDCDDGDAAFNPGAAEEDCEDPADYNCDGLVAYADVDADGWAACVDCDDNSDLINPAMAELCNGVDDNCNGTVDGEEEVAWQDWYIDLDGDGYGDGSVGLWACEQPTGHVADGTDCDDGDPLFHPGAPETDCTDPADYNCDGSTGFMDNDGDGYAACEECDDTLAAVNPAAAELCNGIDDNCDGSTDGADAAGQGSWYLDADGDGYGDPAEMVISCAVPAGYVLDGTDCDDGDAQFNPGAAEPDCTDPNDYNCDGVAAYVDGDNDGYAACEDCDDGSAAVQPGATELCNGIDDNCDGVADGATEVTYQTWYADADGDAYGDPATARSACAQPAGSVAVGTDCDDGDALFHPGASESDCTDPADYNCDGVVAYADGDGDGFAACIDCDDGNAAVQPGATELCNGIDDNCDGTADGATEISYQAWYADVDGDGYGDPQVMVTTCAQPAGYIADSTDCNDTVAAINPGAPEVCDSLNTDEDCNGTADNNDPSAAGKSTWYVDADGDAYGSLTSASFCDAPSGYASTSTDCNDSVAAINPGAQEICDSLNTDEDCDGLADNNDSSATGKSTWYVEADADAYGSGTSASFCDAPSGYASTSTDCNDSVAAINPGAPEVCDSLNTDEDCDGLADNNDSSAAASGKSTWYQDSDGDGYGSTIAALFCDQPSGYAANSTDCNDSAAAISPAAQEICDSLNTDEDCDGTADNNDSSASASGKTTWYLDSDGDGYGATTGASFCDAPSGYVSTSTDCNDSVAAINPGAQEVCDSLNTDEDCDGSADNNDSSASSSGKTTWYLDSDGDGYGSTTSALFCDQPSGYVSSSTDCDDSSASAYPGHPTPGSQIFTYTGAQQTFSVPNCATQVTIAAYGAQGTAAYSSYGYVPGYGGMAQGVLSTSGGSTLYVYVGGSNGYNGGAAGWSGSTRTCNGGGASDVRVGGTALSDRVIVAGGGGGVSGESNWGNGGDGGGGTCGANYCGGEGGSGYPTTSGGNGGTTGGSGVTGCHGGAGGGGGTTGGGVGATTTCYGIYSAGTGTLGVGGAGASSPTGCCQSYGAAGGGGGYYGGGGVAGGCCGGGGAGGGSSWTGTLASPSFAAGVRTGNGQVVITW